MAFSASDSAGKRRFERIVRGLCEPGTLVYLPAGTVHGHRFCAGGGQMLEVTGQGGCAVETFTNVSKEVPPGQPDLTKLFEVLSDNGVTVAA
jgi:hypothetical protein